MIPYFARHGAICPPDTNPAEFVLETVGAGIHAHTGKKASDWAATWRNSPEAISIVDELRAIKESQPFMTEIVEDKSQEFNASIALQTRLLTLRMFYNQWRNVPYLYSKIWVHIISAIMVGFTLFQVGDSPSDLQNRAFSVFFLLFLANAIVNTILARFFFARLYWEVREGPARAYSWVALCNASILAEMPGALICGVLYYCLWYFPSGLPDGGTAGYIFLFTITYEVFQVWPALRRALQSLIWGEASDVFYIGTARPLHDGDFTRPWRCWKLVSFHHLLRQLVQWHHRPIL